MKHVYLNIPLICLSLLFPTHALSIGDPVKGKNVYGTCIACHGQNAEGMLSTNSPNLSGMRDSYLIAQIQKFRSGLRGAKPEDVYGAQMAAMAKTLPDEQAILDVVAYIGTLKSSHISRTENDGDPAQGEKLYFELECLGCHGRKGQGLKGTGDHGQRPIYDAPRLAGQHDWYLIRQLQNFKVGMRGYTGDKAGLLMRFQLVDLDKTQMIKDLVAYIGTLER
jgi:cytochrome c553